jgi:hypothetical protein
VGGIAGDVLEHVSDEPLGVGLADRAELRALSRCAPEPRGLDGQGKTRHRHHVTAEGMVAAQESADTDHALATHRRHLGRGAVLEDGHQ